MNNIFLNGQIIVLLQGFRGIQDVLEEKTCDPFSFTQISKAWVSRLAT